MAKKANITDVSSGYASGVTIDANFDALNDKFDNTLSLDGSTPNAMQADLDMNSNDILNAGTVQATELTVGGATFVPASAVAVYTPDWKGQWLTATAYEVNDLVYQNGSTYICLVAHTSGVFATDLAAARWALFAAKGDSGAGTGDLVSTNNLSDITDADTALANLGGGTTGIAIFKDSTGAAVRAELDLEVGTDLQGYNANLDSLSGITLQAGDLLYATGANTLVRLAKGTADQVLTMNDAATAPQWETPSSTGIGVGQSWSLVSRTKNVSNQNTETKPVMVFFTMTGAVDGVLSFQVSSNGSTWITLVTTGASTTSTKEGSVIIPPNHYYRYFQASGAGTPTFTCALLS